MDFRAVDGGTASLPAKRSAFSPSRKTRSFLQGKFCRNLQYRFNPDRRCADWFIDDPRQVGRAEIVCEEGTERSRFCRGQVDKYTWLDVGSSYVLLMSWPRFSPQPESRAEVQAKRRRLWCKQNSCWFESGFPLPKTLGINRLRHPFLLTRVPRMHCGCGRRCIVRLKLHHGPNDYARRRE